MFIQSRPKVPD